jgi:hypothetical protein
MAYIRKHYSLAVADLVLRAVNAIGVSTDAYRTFTAAAWDNGREQGYVLTAIFAKGEVRRVGVFVAQARGSDEILVVVDERLPASGRNEPSDEAWEKGRRFFKEGQTEQAARHVVAAVEKLLAKYHEA